MASEGSDEELRRVYLDWCATRVAQRFLELSLDDVWLRSSLAASLPTESLPAGVSVPAAADRIPGYLDLVRRTTLLLAQEMELPEFGAWKEAYLKDPRRYEAERMGGDRRG